MKYQNKKLEKTLDNLRKKIIRRKLILAENEWIKENDYINALNYYYYRYFTDRFEHFLIKKSEEGTRGLYHEISE